MKALAEDFRIPGVFGESLRLSGLDFERAAPGYIAMQYYLRTAPLNARPFTWAQTWTAAHLVNILSTVIMPFHKIDFFDEKELE